MSEAFPENEERCADPIDQACAVEQRMRDNDLAVARALSKPEQEPMRALDLDGKPLTDDEGMPVMVWGITECVDCDDDIPPARLALGKVRCVVCQGKLEKRRKLHGG